MEQGKLNWDDLKRIIDGNKGAERKEVIIKSGVGEDCSAIRVEEEDIILSTDPITGATEGIGKLAVHINCNDIASSGGEPLGIMITILAPESSTLEDIEGVMKDISEEARMLNVEILGGHTEVTNAVNRMVVSCTAVGKAKRGKTVATNGAKVGDKIIVTKKLCLEGTSIIVNDKEEEIKGVFSEEEILEGKSYSEELSVVKEGKIAGEFGVNSMHDITEGGVLGALWEVAEASNTGFEVFEDKMPISNITKKLCEYFNIDPLRFISSGSMLITCKDGDGLVKVLKDNGVNAQIIGEVTESRGVLVTHEKREEVTPPERDELFKI